MTVAERWAGLETRERRLLSLFLLIGGVLVLALLPVGAGAYVHGKRSENLALRAAIESIADNREQIQKAKATRARVLERYAHPAPPLAAFLAGLATEEGVEIPESQDRQAVPHGKKYSERSTKIRLNRVGMLKLAKFMERIETSGHPVSVSQLNIRKRGVEPDSYDVDMVVSAFDRKVTEPSKDEPRPGASSATADEPLGLGGGAP